MHATNDRHHTFPSNGVKFFTPLAPRTLYYPVKLVRGKGARLKQYIASSFLSLAIAQLFNTALTHRYKNKPQLAQTPIPKDSQ
ncbi:MULTISPECIES: hypothetical protein [Calothrix]|uniref:hypothetical protein n=1 Tax=Calothrix TaxID=1186 RepID=UPI0028C47E24|nr:MULTISPECIES: hypothetical protein [Calothrix]